MSESTTSQDLIRKSIFEIGHVLSVEGRTVTVRLYKNKNQSHLLYDGQLVKNISVGSYVKITKGFVDIVGKVEGEYIHEDKEFNKNYNKEETKIVRNLKISLFGHFENQKITQGTKELPLVNNKCFLLTKEEFDNLHNFFSSDEATIEVGSLTEEPSQTVRIGVNNLFASHIGIFGNTGSGKSNTLTKIYTQLFDNYSNNDNFYDSSKFIIIDFNGEYTNSEIITQKKTYTNYQHRHKKAMINIQSQLLISIKQKFYPCCLKQQKKHKNLFSIELCR